MLGRSAGGGLAQSTFRGSLSVRVITFQRVEPTNFLVGGDICVNAPLSESGSLTNQGSVSVSSGPDCLQGGITMKDFLASPAAGICRSPNGSYAQEWSNSNCSQQRS